MENIKIGYIGLGCRGKDLLENIVLAQKEQVVAVCDVYEDRAREGAKVVEAAGQPTPFVSTDYKDIIANEEVNTIIIATAWESHVEIALAAMYAGKAVAMEVGGAYSLEDCYKLVDAYEKTKTPFMFLENCCFGRRELMVLNMVDQGVLGEVVHCAGGYQHDLRDEIAFGKENRHYRLRNYLSRNCENYPTHDLGPIAKILNINHGNRMLTLSSFASKSAGLHEFILQNKSDDEELKQAHFAQGDIITTMIRCANGETIQRDILAHLRQEAHSLGIMNLDILQSRIHVMIQEDTGSRTFPRTHGDHRTGHQTVVFPTGRLYQPWRNLDQAPHAYRDIACIIHQMTCISLEGDTGTGSQLPAFSLRYKHAIPYLIAYPWSHLEGDPAFQRIVLHHFYL